MSFFFRADAQGQNNSIRPLKIGDTIPEAVWNMPLQVVNHPEGKKTITLNDYRGELIILDFWATWCSSCIKKFPTLYSLQKENQQHLKVIPVNCKSTKDDKEKVNRFLTQRKIAYNFTSIVEDTILRNLFPHTAIPHYSWIKNNKVIAITDADGITKENVEGVLRGIGIKATPVKIAYNPKQFLFEDGNGGEPPKYIYKSILAPYVEGLKRRMYVNENEEGLINKLTITNSPLIDFYRYAYPILANITPARMILNISAPSRFTSDSISTSWKALNFYNYEALFPRRPREKAMETLQADLNRFLVIALLPSKGR
ncbi:TlpA family protein disulfide reductase [Pedobacter sp. NJ-S-72]